MPRLEARPYDEFRSSLLSKMVQSSLTEKSGVAGRIGALSNGTAAERVGTVGKKNAGCSFPTGRFLDNRQAQRLAVLS
jgi:hypothetical protein